ncbi:MAG TPA: response regulator [Verrucomicrobiae bacterium]|nr:response regulator [Verrucomicrobiae bacterium]
MDSSSSAKGDILIVEDDPRQIRLYSKTLRGYQLTCVTKASAALEEIRQHPPDLIILDHILADGELGTDYLPRLKEVAAHVPVIIISGTLDIRGKLKALQGPRAAHYVLEKPVDLDELDATVENALRECGMGETIRELQSLERAEKIESNEPERRFTERLARQHEILNRLRGTSERPNISRLAREFNVSRKTIIRDLQDLIQRGQLDSAIYPDWNSVSQV